MDENRWAAAIYGGGSNLFATTPGQLDIMRFEGTYWSHIGGPASSVVSGGPWTRTIFEWVSEDDHPIFAVSAWSGNIVQYLPPPCGTPGPFEAVIYQHVNLGGHCRVLGVGNYPTSSNFSPVGNDSISSLNVDSNVRVILYQDTWYKGDQAQYEGGQTYWHLGDFNDRASSIQVVPR